MINLLVDVKKIIGIYLKNDEKTDKFAYLYKGEKKWIFFFHIIN